MPAVTLGSGATAPTVAAGDKWGFSVGGGLRINLDMLARGDVFWLQATYTDGMLGYVLNNGNSDLIGANRNSTAGPFNYSQASNVPFAYRDAIVNPALGANGTIQTTKAWGIAAGFRHFWTPACVRPSTATTPRLTLRSPPPCRTHPVVGWCQHDLVAGSQPRPRRRDRLRLDQA